MDWKGVGVSAKGGVKDWGGRRERGGGAAFVSSEKIWGLLETTAQTK